MRPVALLSTAASLLAAATFASAAHSHPHPHPHSPKPNYPFDHIIAFGDNLSDNGNGSYSHGLTSKTDPHNTVYGYKTWTDGPVAVSYLSTRLGVPLRHDYAFGGAYGGSIAGATINNHYTHAEFAPDAFQQVHNYTTHPHVKRAHVKRALHFVWIGNNDVSLSHIEPWHAKNHKFARAIASNMERLVARLVSAGAEHVFVAAIYPKQLAPFARYITHNPTQVRNLGKAIKQANEATHKRLKKKFGKKVIYYDAFRFMSHVYHNHNKYGIKYVLPHFCDGHSPEDWHRCVTEGHGDEFFWMQSTDMTTRVHSLVAHDMAKKLRARFSKKKKN